MTYLSRHPRASKAVLTTLAVASMLTPVVSRAQTASPSLTAQMGIDQKLGAEVPRDVPFKDELGQTVTLGQYLGKRPVLILPVFYSCQTGCAVITDSLVKTLARAAHPNGFAGLTAKGQPQRILEVGRDLDIIEIGINPKETPELAASKKAVILDAYNQPGASEHWHLLTGKLEDIRRVTDALGFRYYYNPKNGVIRHPTGSIIVSPNGHVSSYTIGNDFPTKILQDDLAVAAQNRVGEKADQSFMFGCLMLDPATGHIRVVVENIVRIACFVTFAVLAGSIISMTVKDRNRRRLDSTATPRGGQPTGV